MKLYKRFESMDIQSLCDILSNKIDTVLNKINDLDDICRKINEKKDDMIRENRNPCIIGNPYPQILSYLDNGEGRKKFVKGDYIPFTFLDGIIHFEVVEVFDRALKLISSDIIACEPFDVRDRNTYEDSSIKRYVEFVLPKMFDEPVITKLLNGNKLYIPSEEEIISAYPEEEKRIKQYKLEEYPYWLSTPNYKYPGDVRVVDRSGELRYAGADEAYGVVVACVIGKQ